MQEKCVVCGKIFNSNVCSQICCSNTCRRENYRQSLNKKMLLYYHKYKDKWNKKLCPSKRKEFILLKNKKCEICSSNKDLEIHHINYSREFEDLSLLCQNCHRIFHKSYIFENDNKKFLKNKEC